MHYKLINFIRILKFYIHTYLELFKICREMIPESESDHIYYKLVAKLAD